MSLRTPEEIIERNNGDATSTAMVVLELQSALETFIDWFEHDKESRIAVGEARALRDTVTELRIEDGDS